LKNIRSYLVKEYQKIMEAINAVDEEILSFKVLGPSMISILKDFSTR